MQLSKVTYALVAAGLIGGVATFYHQLDSSPVGAAIAATQPSTLTAVAPTAAANLPDFSALVDRVAGALAAALMILTAIVILLASPIAQLIAPNFDAAQTIGGLGAMDESPDFYLWLAAQSDQSAAPESL